MFAFLDSLVNDKKLHHRRLSLIFNWPHMGDNNLKNNFVLLWLRPLSLTTCLWKTRNTDFFSFYPSKATMSLFLDQSGSKPTFAVLPFHYTFSSAYLTPVLCFPVLDHIKTLENVFPCLPMQSFFAWACFSAPGTADLIGLSLWRFAFSNRLALEALFSNCSRLW